MLLTTTGLADEHGLITRARAVAAGLDDRDIRRLVKNGDWQPLRRGVYVESALWRDLDAWRGQPLLRVHAARRVLRSPHVVSHDSSALAHGLGVPDATRSLVHVTRRKVHGDAVRAGVKHHLAPYRDDQVVRASDLPVLDVARTALDLAREHGLAAGVAACDQALRRGVTRGVLQETRSAMWCWPESRVMDAALSLADPGAESWLESEARLFVIRLDLEPGLALGRPQTQFGLTDGTRTVFCDFRIGRHVFEVDGRSKYDDQLQGRRLTDILMQEKQRHDFVAGFKLGISRLTAHDIHGASASTAVRVQREFADTCARFGTDISDLTPFLVRRRHP